MSSKKIVKAGSGGAILAKVSGWHSLIARRSHGTISKKQYKAEAARLLLNAARKK